MAGSIRSLRNARHSQLGDPNNFQHFMKNMAIVGGSLAFVAFGGGAFSLDARKP
jgi:putative oxidoreductase